MAKVFPIVNDAACVFKWGWNTFRVHTGESSSCHRVRPEAVPIDQFDLMHHMPGVMRDRERMGRGQWPESGRGCEYCKNIEDQGGISDRLYHNNIPGLTPVDFDTKRDHASARISEVYLDNTCDLACVYCIPQFSSKINDELLRFGASVTGLTYLQRHDQSERYFELYLDWLECNYHNLQRLSILGGEPLLQKKLWKMLERLEHKTNSDLELTINTNLNASTSTVERYVEACKKLLLQHKIKRADIQVSIDCWGAQQEFIRHGLDLNQWQKNFEYLIQHRWLHIGVHQVVTNLSLGTVNDLQKLLGVYKKQNPRITQNYHLPDAHKEIYHPEIFGGNFWRPVLEDIENGFVLATEFDQQCLERLQGIKKSILAGSPDIRRLGLLKQTLDQLDLRRGTDWKSLFPIIDQYFTTHEIL